MLSSWSKALKGQVGVKNVLAGLLGVLFSALVFAQNAPTPLVPGQETANGSTVRTFRLRF
jgi:hypothetical protein